MNQTINESTLYIETIFTNLIIINITINKSTTIIGGRTTLQPFDFGMFYCHFVDKAIDYEAIGDIATVNHAVGEEGLEVGL